MKKITIITLVILVIVSIASIASEASRPTSAETSWNAFCETRGYEITNKSDSVVTEYLDTWRGSADEEAALDAAGVEQF